jgi:hypothetical protein
MESIPQKRRRRNANEKPDPATVRRLYDHDGKSYREIAELLHSNYAAVYRAYHAAPANGTPGSAPSTPTALERTIVIGEPVSAPPEYHSTPAHDVLVQRVEIHDQRLDVLEAFMRAMEQHPSYRKRTSAPSTPEYTAPRAWKKTGAEFAPETHEKLRAYAKTHGLQLREVMEMAFQAFLAAHEAPLPVPDRGDKEVGGA